LIQLLSGRSFGGSARPPDFPARRCVHPALARGLSMIQRTALGFDLCPGERFSATVDPGAAALAGAVRLV